MMSEKDARLAIQQLEAKLKSKKLTPEEKERLKHLKEREPTHVPEEYSEAYPEFHHVRCAMLPLLSLFAVDRTGNDGLWSRQR